MITAREKSHLGRGAEPNPERWSIASIPCGENQSPTTFPTNTPSLPKKRPPKKQKATEDEDGTD